ELVREQPRAVPFEDRLLHNDHVSNGNCAEASKPSSRQTKKPRPRGFASDALGFATTCHRGGNEPNQCRRRGPHGVQHSAQASAFHGGDRQANRSASLWLIYKLAHMQRGSYAIFVHL